MKCDYRVTLLLTFLSLSCQQKVAVSGVYRTIVLANRLLFVIKCCYYCCSHRATHLQISKEQCKEGTVRCHQ